MNATHDHAAGSAPALAAARRRRRRLADRPIRVKLTLLLVALSAVTGQLAGELQQGRAAAALTLGKTAPDGAVDGFQRQTLRTDVAAGRFDTAADGAQVPAGLRPAIGRTGEQVDGPPLSTKDGRLHALWRRDRMSFRSTTDLRNGVARRLSRQEASWR